MAPDDHGGQSVPPSGVASEAPADGRDQAATWAETRQPGFDTRRLTDSGRGQAGQVEDLAESVAALSHLSARALELTVLLRQVATFAVRAIPGAEGAGLTLLEKGRSDVVVTTAAFVAEVDNLQYGIGEGPCILAVAQGQTVRSGSLGADRRWPRFGGGVARLGVHSAVSLPLTVGGDVVGVMNVYAHDKHVFDERAAELGEMFAAPAAIAVQNAHVLAEMQRLVLRLQRDQDSRSIIDQAVGILISRSGGTAAQALSRLRTISQREHQKLPELAHRLVDEAARRAHSRTSGG